MLFVILEEYTVGSDVCDVGFHENTDVDEDSLWEQGHEREALRKR